MKKRMLSLFLCLVLCLSLSPMAAWADDTQSTDDYIEVISDIENETESAPDTEAEAESASEAETESASEAETESASEEETESVSEEETESASEEETESASEDETESASEAETADKVIAAIQARIDALPDAEAVAAMDAAQRDAVYEAAQDICDAIDALDEAQQALLNTAALNALLVWFNEQTEATGDHVHCVCGKASCSAHGGAHSFTAWTDALAATQNGEGKTASNSLPSDPNGGYYYLTADVELTQRWTPRKNAVICLNGHSITMTTSDGFVIVVAGTFTLTDCQTTGKITTAADKTGCGVTVSSGKTFNLYGGSITGNSNGSGAGGVEVSEGAVFNMYGGSISDNRASKGAGVYNSGTFNMYGGTISGNTGKDEIATSYVYGAGVYNEGSFQLSGGTISSNTATQGGGVYNVGGSTLTMSGGTISSNKAHGYGRNGQVKNADGGGVYNEGKKSATATFTMTGGTISGNTCGGVSYLSGGTVHGHGAGVYNSGSFLLSAGTIADNTMNIRVGSDDVNGDAGAYGGGVYSSGSFTMTGGTISGNTIGSYSTQMESAGAMHSHGGGVFIRNGSFTMSGGTVSNNRAVYGGGVYVGGGSFVFTKGSVTNNTAAENGGGIENHGTATLGAADLTGTTVFVTGNRTEATLGGFGGGIVNYGELTVSGGTTINSNTAQAGGGIANHGTMTLTDGAIVTGNSADSGGGVYTAKTATMNNTTISHNAAPDGGGIRNVGTLTLGDGVEVTLNTASTSGGGILSSGTLIVSGSAVVHENTAPIGGGLTVVDGTAELKGSASIKNNTSTTSGGGIANYGTLTLADSFVVSDNTAPNGGGVYNAGTATLEGMARIRSNTASLSGGGVYNTGTVTLDGAIIEMNTATESGGGVYNAKTLNMTGGTIGARSSGSGNTAANGGGVYNADTITVTNGYIMYNTATKSGGGVYDAGKSFNISGTFSWVSYNTATEYGGGIYHESGTLNMNGGAVTANRAYAQGGGVYYSQNDDGETHPVKLNGQITLTGNYGGGTTSNLYLSWPTTVGSTRTLDVKVGTLFGNSRIGISTNHAPTDSYQYITISLNTNANNKGYFVSDSSEYKVEIVDSKLVLLRECAHAHLGQDPSGNYTCQDCGRDIVAAVTDTVDGTKVSYFIDLNDALAALAWDGTGVLRLMRSPSTTMTLSANKTYRLEYAEGVDLTGSTIRVTAGHVTLRGASFGSIVESRNGTYSTGEVIIDVDTSDGMVLQGIKTERSGRTVFSMLHSASGDNDCKLYGFMKKDDKDISRSTWRDYTTTVTQAYAVTVKQLPFIGLTLKKGDAPASDTEIIPYGDALDLTAAMTGVTVTPPLGITLDANTVYCWSVNNEIMLEGRGESAYTFYTKIAGTYTVSCEARYQGYTQQTELTVVIEPVAVTASDFTVEDREYDGSTKATVTGLTVTTADGTALAEGTDYSVSASFADTNVGEDKPVTVTVTLKNTGYVFREGDETASEKTFTKTATVHKLPCAEAGNVIRYVQNGEEKVYTFSLNALLNTLQGEQGYGSIAGEKLLYVPEAGAEAYYSDTEGKTAYFETNDETGALQIKLPMQSVAEAERVANRSKIGTLYVDVSSENVELTKKTDGPEGMEEYTISIAVYVTAIEMPDANSDLLALERRTITYGETLDDIEKQANAYGEQYGRFDWKNAEDAKTLFTAGTHWIGWKFTLKGETEPVLEGVVPITVNKATPVVTAELAPKVYDGQPIEAADITGTAVNPVNGSLTVKGSWSWKGEAPKDACAEQEYTVVFTPDDTDNYTTAETTVLVTIEQRDVSINGVTAVEREYEYDNNTVELEGGELSQASDTPSIVALFSLFDGAAANSGVISGDMVGFRLGEGTLNSADFGDDLPVTTNIVLTGRDAGNYRLTQPTDIKVNIKAKDISGCVIEVESLTYTGEPQTPRVYVEGVQVPATFVKVTPQTDPGSYTLTIETPNGNYRFGNELSRSFDWSIAKAPAVQLTDAAVMLHYGDHSSHRYPLAERSGVPANAGKLDYTLGSAPDGVTVSIDADGELSYSVTGTTEADVGSVFIVPVLVESEHYEPMTVSLVITVTDKSIPTLTAADVTKTYDGKPVPASGTATYDGRAIAGMWSWKLGGSYDSALDESAQPVHVQDSGVWRLVFTPDDAVTYAAVEALVNVTIEPRAVTLRSEDLSKTYDGKALENGSKAVTATGMVNGEAFDYDFTGSQTAVGHSDNAFAAKDSATARVSDYTITYRFGTLTVTADKTGGSTSGGAKPVRTGDESTPFVWAFLLLLALGATVCIVIRRKKHS